MATRTKRRTAKRVTRTARVKQSTVAAEPVVDISHINTATITQKALAQHSGLSESGISLLMAGKRSNPSLNTLIKLQTGIQALTGVMCNPAEVMAVVRTIRRRPLARNSISQRRRSMNKRKRAAATGVGSGSSSAAAAAL